MLLRAGPPLDEVEVVRYLVDRGAVAAGELVREDFFVERIERKNISYVLHISRPVLILKSARDSLDHGVEREAAAYEALRTLPGARTLAGSIPSLRFYDTELGLLALEFETCTKTLRQFHETSGRAPARVGRAAGRLLRDLHEVMPRAKPAKESDDEYPWAMTLQAPTMAVLETESSGTLDILRRIQESSPLGRACEQARESWVGGVLCHHDIRLDNFLVRDGIRGSAGLLVLLDWELCGPGDELWDLACFIAGYVELWAVHALRTSDPGGPANVPKRWQIGTFKPLLLAFWQGYLTKGPLTRDAVDVSAATARLIGVRLLQSALEYSQRSNHPTRESLALVSLSEPFMCRPLEAWGHILGLPLGRLTGAIDA